MYPIHVFCRTNIDAYKGEKWPKKFTVSPRIGDWVRSEGDKVLKICMITHCVVKKGQTWYFPEGTQVGDPYIEVELTNTIGG